MAMHLFVFAQHRVVSKRDPIGCPVGRRVKYASRFCDLSLRDSRRACAETVVDGTMHWPAAPDSTTWLKPDSDCNAAKIFDDNKLIKKNNIDINPSA